MSDTSVALPDYGDVPPPMGAPTALPANVQFNPDGSFIPGPFGLPPTIGGFPTKTVLIALAAVVALYLVTRRS